MICLTDEAAVPHFECDFLSPGCQDLGVAPPPAPAKVPPPAPVSFKQDVLPIFIRYGCYQCHGGTNGLVVQAVAGLLKGGLHGAAMVRGNAGSSLIIEKTSPTPPFSDRMPQGGPYCPDSIRVKIAAWINQGAKDNSSATFSDP